MNNDLVSFKGPVNAATPVKTCALLLFNVSTVCHRKVSSMVKDCNVIVFSDTMAHIIFAERENAGLHPPSLKMRQRLQSAPGMEVPTCCPDFNISLCVNMH